MPDLAGRTGVGLALPNQLPGIGQTLRDRVAEIEGWGYDSLWVTDHVVGTRSMEEVYEPFWLEALSTLAWLAAATRTVRLGTGVLVLPHRNPVLVAKMLTTIDVLSGGRLDVGVGTGWSRVEFRALGVEDLFEGRGAAADQCLTILRACWGGGPLSYEGEPFSFKNVVFEPQPVQRPGPPIWVGGCSRAALRRAAQYGDGWHPHDLGAAELAELGGRLDEEASRAVRRSVRVDVAALDAHALPELVAGYLAAGCEFVVVEFRSVVLDDVLRRAEAVAEVLCR